MSSRSNSVKTAKKSLPTSLCFV